MREMILEMVDELLDMEGDVVIGNLTFARSAIVRKLDPIAYDMMVADVVDSQISDLEYELERLDEVEDAEEIEDLKARIEEMKECL